MIGLPRSLELLDEIIDGLVLGLPQSTLLFPPRMGSLLYPWFPLRSVWLNRGQANPRLMQLHSLLQVLVPQ